MSVVHFASTPSVMYSIVYWPYRTHLTVPTAAQAVGLIPSRRMGVSGKQAPVHDVKLV